MLEGKRILVTGASGGIGAAIAKSCSSYGAIVFAGYSRNKDAAEALVRSKEASQAVLVNLSEASTLEAAIQEVCKDGGRIDGLVNCAGINIAGPLAALESVQISEQIKTNLEGVIRLTQAATIAMVRQRSGSVLNVSSVSAHRFTRGHAVYSATKAGLEGFTQAMAAELAKRNIRVNCLIPGPVLTKMLQASIDETGDDPAARVPLGRLIEAHEVAEAAAFLLSDRASGITGALVPVDGGYSLW